MRVWLVLLASGAIVLAGGLAGYFLNGRVEWFFMSFVGMLLALGGFATYGGGKDK